MNAQELKNKLSTENIITIITTLGSELISQSNKEIVFSTYCCHGGNSPKLYYNLEHKSFMCYSECGHQDILSIVQNNKGFNLYEAIQYICNLIGISTMKQGFSNETITRIEDWSFINGYNRKKQIKELVTLKAYDPHILNIFQTNYSVFLREWIDDGISINVLTAFGIQYSTLKQSIIIPHYSSTCLVGVRQRYMLEDDIYRFGKYNPFFINNKMYNHQLGENLYGININKACIQRTKKVMLVEGEKSCLQCASMFGVENNFTLALCGSVTVSETQKNLLIQMGVDEVIIALDRQYESVGTEEYHKWIAHLQDKIIRPLLPYFKVYVILDQDNLLGYKDSPLDKGKEILLTLMHNKLYATN